MFSVLFFLVEILTEWNNTTNYYTIHFHKWGFSFCVPLSEQQHKNTWIITWTKKKHGYTKEFVKRSIYSKRVFLSKKATKEDEEKTIFFWVEEKHMWNWKLPFKTKWKQKFRFECKQRTTKNHCWSFVISFLVWHASATHRSKTTTKNLPFLFKNKWTKKHTLLRTYLHIIYSRIKYKKKVRSPCKTKLLIGIVCAFFLKEKTNLFCWKYIFIIID